MPEQSDVQLLRDYAGHGDETAFREIVARHADFVYSAALRQMGSPDLAADVTQSVFVDLAHKAKSVADGLPAGASLVGWLYRSTRYAAFNHSRAARRRDTHERLAIEQMITNSEAGPDWEQICPVLDEAMAALNDDDREALLLRYFKNLDFRAVGAALGISDDAAQKRVSRAVERLRELFAKGSVTVGAGGLVVIIAANAVQAAPAGLVGTICTAALAATAVTATTIATATKAIAMTTMQKVIVAATLAVVAGAGIYEARQASQLRDKVQQLQQQQAPMAAQIQQLQQERDNATNRLANLQDEIGRTKNSNLELLKLRGENAKLFQDSKELAQIKAKEGQTGASNRFLDLAMSERKAEMTSAVLKKLAGMKAQLGLTADQEGQIRNILLGDIDARVQAQMSVVTTAGSVQEQKDQEKKILADEEAQIATVLSPDQQTAYEQMKKDQEATWAMNYAKSEALAMNQYLNISPEQSQAVVSILASLPAGQGGRGNAQDADAKAQLEIRLQALSQTLTPDQLQAYRREKLAQIEQAAAAIQMIKSLAN